MVPKGLQSTLRLKGPAERQDSARFECLARNDFGSNKTEINFIVQVSISNYPFITDWLRHIENVPVRRRTFHNCPESIVGRYLKNNLQRGNHFFVSISDKQNSSDAFLCQTFFSSPLYRSQEVPETPKNFVMVSHSSRQANLSWGLPYDGQSPLLAFHLEFQRPVGKFLMS